MSHNILKNDLVIALEKCWHGLEKIVANITFENSGLNWQVAEHPILANGAPLDGWKALIREDKNLPLHVFKDSYHVIQNSQIWEAMNQALAGIPFKVVTAGSLGNCKRTFISIKLTDQPDSFVRGDQFKDYLTFINSFDGFCTARLYGSNVRVVCANTLNASLSDKGFLDLNVKHTASAAVKFERMAETVQSYLQSKAAFYADLANLAEQPMSNATAANLLAGFVADGKELSARSANQGKKMFDLFQHGKGNKGETRYDLLNGVTEYYTHEASSNAGKSLASNMLGTYGAAKTEMLDILLDDNMLDSLAKKGEALLKESEFAIA